ncbi:MAG: hypothetical protein OXD32_04905 [Endozoicomonadaceae bacterium]|nr:hypothetical protein [Endozoicomonadaceae bacterium]
MIKIKYTYLLYSQYGVVVSAWNRSISHRAQAMEKLTHLHSELTKNL